MLHMLLNFTWDNQKYLKYYKTQLENEKEFLKNKIIEHFLQTWL